jgi:NRPS condensation-like uncharacterized protein
MRHYLADSETGASMSLLHRPRRQARAGATPTSARDPEGDLRASGAPFSVLDELSCYHDDATEPNNVHLEIRLHGHLDAAALRAATEAALAALPRARFRRARHHALTRRYRWELPARQDCDPVSVTSWKDEADLAGQRTRFLNRRVPLDVSPPLRLLLAAGPTGDCVILAAHHAALDGFSCLELLREIARGYPARADQRESPGAPDGGPHGPPEAARRHPLRPARPGPGGRTPRAPAASPPRRPAPRHAGPRQGKRRTWHGTTRIAADVIGGDRSGYGYLLMPALDLAVLQAFRSRSQATVNDLLICALIVTIAEWNGAHGRPADRIKITMPINARPEGQEAAIGNLSRLDVVCAPWSPPAGDAGRLLSLVALQTQAAKGGGPGAERPAGPGPDLVSRVFTALWLPAEVKRWLVRSALRTVGRAVVDTSLVSNLGSVADPPHFGSAEVVQMAFSTAAHMPRGLSVGAITVRGQLQLCLRYHQALLDDDAAGRFAQCYGKAVSELARL